METCRFADAGKTKPIQTQFPKSQNERNFYFNKGLWKHAASQTQGKQTQSNPISKAKLQPCKLGLIKRIWCYKATIAFTKNNANLTIF